MSLRPRTLLAAAPLVLLALALAGASRRNQPRANPIAPKAVLNGLAPDAIAAGAPGFTLTVNGGFFTKSSIVQWNGQARPTTVVNDTVLRAEIRAGDISSPGGASVTVLNAGASPSEYPGVSNALPFRVIPSSLY